MGNKITYFGKEYDLDALSGETQATLALAEYVERELQFHNMKIATLQTARQAYAASLKEALDAVEKR